MNRKAERRKNKAKDKEPLYLHPVEANIHFYNVYNSLEKSIYET